VTTDKILDGAVTAAKIANRTREFFVPAIASGATLTEGSPFGVFLDDNNAREGSGFSSIPRDFVSNLVVKTILYSEAAGNVYFGFGYESVVAGEGLILSASPTARPILAEEITEYTETVTGVAAGDYIIFRGIRQGGNVLDTVGANVYLIGWSVSYTADS
jgi:hypothetical protein